MRILLLDNHDFEIVPQGQFDRLKTFTWWRTGWGQVRGFKDGKFTWLHEELDNDIT